MNLNVSRPQFNKLTKGKAINVSHGALMKGGYEGRGFSISINQPHIPKISKAIKIGKGIRIGHDDVSFNGGSILGSISKKTISDIKDMNLQ